MVLKIHNTLTGTKEIFKPVDESHVRVYACGPTVYNFAHIGNARMAVANDLLINVLRTQFKKVTYVSNITDIDDKIIEAAHELNEPIKNLTTKYTKIYNEGENIPENQKSIAISVTIQSQEKTLKEADLDQINKSIIETVENKTGAKIRS